MSKVQKPVVKKTKETKEKPMPKETKQKPMPKETKQKPMPKETKQKQVVNENENEVEPKIINFGKHKNKTYNDMLNEDMKKYVNYLKRAPVMNDNMKDFLTWYDNSVNKNE